MKKQVMLVALLLVFGLGTVAAAAEKPSKFWIMATSGVRGSGSFDIQSEEQIYSGIHFDTAVTYGLTFGYRFSSILAIEGMWSRSSSTVKGTDPGDETTPPVSDTLLETYEDKLHANLLLSTGYTMGPVKPFFLLGVGISRFDPKTDVSGFTRFSWSFGLGMEALVSGQFGVRAHAAFSPTYINTIDEILVEWEGGTQTAAMRNTMTQWEFQAGLFFRF